MDGMTTWFAANGDALANGLSKALEIAVMAFRALGEAVAFFLESMRIILFQFFPVL